METEKILLDIQVDEGEIGKAVKLIQEARTKMDELKKSQKELEKQGQKNTEQYILQEAEIKNLNKEVAESSKVLQANTNMVAANEDSLKALKKETSELVKQRDSMSYTTEEGRKKIAELNTQIDKNTKIIGENSSGIEKQRANIGNYKSALDGVVPGLGGMSEKLTEVTQAEGGFIQGMKGMITQSLAFLATPIGLVIAAIGAALGILVTFLKNSTAGMDLMEDAMAVVSAVMNVLIDRVVSLAKAIGSLLIMDFEGFAKNSEAAFSGLGDELEREVGLALELAEAMRQLEDAEIAYEIAASKNENTIKKLMLQAKNRTLDEKERSKLLSEALEIERKQNEELLRIKTLALKIANDEAAMRINLARNAGESEEAFAQRLIDTGLVLDDYRNKIVDSLKARNEAEGQSLAFQEKIQNQIDALAEKTEDDRQKRSDKAAADREKREEEIKKHVEAEAEAVRNLTIFSIEQDIKRTQSIDERVQKEIALETVRRDLLLQNDQLTNSERALIEAQYQAELTGIEAKGAADRKAAEEKDNQEWSDLRDEQFDDLVDKLEEQNQILINEEKEKFLNGLITREEYENSLDELELGFLIARQEINKQFGDEDLRLTGAITDQKIAMAQFEHDTVVALEQAKLAAISGVLGQTAGLFKKQTIAYKALASAQALIQTYQSAQSVFTGFTTQIPGPVGMALGIAAAIAAVAAGLANVAKINNVKLKQGGAIAVEGPGHEQGGVPLSIGGQQVAEIEGGEHVVVLKRGANEHLKMLSQANKRAGGKDFYRDRTPTRYAADGGFVPSTVSSSVNSTLDIRSLDRAFSNAVERLPAPEVNIHEITKMQNKVSKVKVRSELS
jgi:hypothetical protein